MSSSDKPRPPGRGRTTQQYADRLAETIELLVLNVEDVDFGNLPEHLQARVGLMMNKADKVLRKLNREVDGALVQFSATRKVVTRGPSKKEFKFTE